MFWDEYEKSTADQRIRGRALDPKERKTHNISPLEPGTRGLSPVVLDSSNEGLCVAWVKLTDVIGGDGVVDMIHTAHVATVSNDDNWSMITDENGSNEGTVFLSGLLPDLRKGKGYPSGYSGNRRKPMLLDGKDCVWLLWERKSKHSGSGSKTTGQLLGRKFKDGKWASCEKRKVSPECARQMKTP